MDKSPLWIKIALAVFLTFLLHELALWFAIYDLSFSLFNPTDFSRWDSGLYIHIAQNGYELMPCHEVFDSYPKTSTEWCGNAGWMPLYSYLIRIGMATGLSANAAGYVLSKFFLLIVYLCLHILSQDRNLKQKTALIILAALFPGSVYYDSVFPISLMLALVLGSYCLWKFNYQKAAILTAFFIPMSYSTGFVVIGVWFFLVLQLRAKKETYRTAVQVIISMVVGFASFFVIQKLSVGVWNGFFLIQGKYGHGIHNTFASFYQMILSVWYSGINGNWQNIQTLCFLGLMIYSCFKISKNMETETFFFLCYFIIMFAFPIIIGSANHSQYRSQALLLPLLLTDIGKKNISWFFIPVFLYFFISCSIEFFMGTIV